MEDKYQPTREESERYETIVRRAEDSSYLTKQEVEVVIGNHKPRRKTVDITVSE